MTMQTTLSAACPPWRAALACPEARRVQRRNTPLRYRVPRSHPSRPATWGSLATNHSSLITEFLIANARLEFPPTPTKHSVDTKSNRKYTRVLRAPWRIAILQFAPQLLRQAASHEVSSSLSEGRGLIPSINRLEFSPLSLVYPEPRRAQPHPRKLLVRRLPRGATLTNSGRATTHSSLVTAFLIDCSAIRNPRKALKT
jgi:hypothetical protein